MGVVDLIKNAFGAIANFFGWAQQRDAEKNDPSIKANAEAADVQRQRDKIAKDAANPDGGPIGKDLAP